VKRFLAALVMLAAGSAAWAETAAPEVTTMETAEFLVSDAEDPPADSALWQPIALPDNWHLSRPGFEGQVWYRLRFDVPQVFIDAKRGHALYSPRNAFMHVRFFLNGNPLAFGRVYGDPLLTETQRPFLLTVPSLMLRAGENHLYIRMSGHAEERHGLSRVSIGLGYLVRRLYYQPRYDYQVTSIAMFGAALLCAGVLALSVWWGRRSDPVLLWFAIVALAWSGAAYLFLWPPDLQQDSVRQLLYFVMEHGYVTPLLVLCLRIGGARAPRLEALLWLAFTLCCAAATLAGVELYSRLLDVAAVMYLFLAATALAWLIHITSKEGQRNSLFLGLALATLIAFSGYDGARWIGYTDFDNLLLTPFAMPFLILALSDTVVLRHLSVVRALARANAELERDVAEKMREVEWTYSQMQTALREQAVLRERQRIMTDMHDGLGSGLIGLLSLVRSRGADLAQVERRLDDLLTDLRAIVDSFQPMEGDLGVVLGNVRYRMSGAIERSGVNLAWLVEQLPPIEYLTPDMVLSIQRIVLEALANALRHAAASNITVSAKYIAERGAIRITIADDGVGFAPERAERGHGLRNMRGRATKIGIPIEIDSSPGGGTRVTLELGVGKDVSPGERAGLAS